MPECGNLKLLRIGRGCCAVEKGDGRSTANGLRAIRNLFRGRDMYVASRSDWSRNGHKTNNGLCTGVRTTDTITTLRW